MATMHLGNVSGGLHGRPWSMPEDVERFLAGSRAEYEIPGAELHSRTFRGDSNVAMDLFAMQTVLNALSSGKAGKGDAYGQFHMPESRRLADALAELAEVDDETAEENLPPVGEATKTEAERLVRNLTRQSRRLADALAELAEVDDETAEENLPPVGEATKTEAERLVRNLTRRAPASVLLAVYPTQDAGIALHFKAPDRPASVLVLLRDDGRADCHTYIGGRSRRAHYGTSEDLPDAFVLDQLRRLAPPRVGVSTPGAGFSSSWMAFPSTNLR